MLDVYYTKKEDIKTIERLNNQLSIKIFICIKKRIKF